MHGESPNVYRLPVHLPDQHTVYFNAEDDIDEVLERPASRKTPLTAWLEANTKYEAAHTVTYQNAPQTWVYNKTKKEWTPRQHGEGAVGRLYFASPAQGERFYLRMLSTIVTGK